MLKLIDPGNKLASHPPANQPVASSPPQIHTLGDYFSVAEKTNAVSKQELSMQRYAAGRVADMLGVPRDQIQLIGLDDLVDIRPQLTQYLTRSHYPRESIRSLCDYARRIVHTAEKLGWSARNAEIRAAWEALCI